MKQETMFEILCPKRRIADRRAERTDGRRKDDTNVMSTIMGTHWMPVGTRMAMIEAIRGVMNENSSYIARKK